MYLRPVWYGTFFVFLVLAGIGLLLHSSIQKKDGAYLMIQEADTLELVHELMGGEGATHSHLSKTGMWGPAHLEAPPGGVFAQAVYSMFWIPDSVVWTYQFDREMKLIKKARLPLVE